MDFIRFAWVYFTRLLVEVVKSQTNAFFFVLVRKPQSDFSPTWLPVTQKIMRYLKIDTDPKLVSGSLPFYQRTLFWNHIAHFVVDNREI